jgi:penicillin-binding protein 2
MKPNFSRERLRFLLTGFFVAGAALFLRLFEMQVLEGSSYKFAAERNRTQMIYQTAPRGIIYDKNGVPLATNAPVFSLVYIPPKTVKEADLRGLARELSFSVRGNSDRILENLEHAVQAQTALRIAENLPLHIMFRLSELKSFYPGIDLVLEARRYYPFGRFAGHLIGYMGKMSPSRWKNLKYENYRMDSRIGRLGVESVFERDLRGSDGAVRMEVDAQGRIKRTLEHVPWRDGNNVFLTIDEAVQRAAEEGLRRSPTGRGAVIALDPSNGAILALAATPDFNPNELLGEDPFSVQYETATLLAIPEFNRAISGLYAPGSTFKTIVSIAGISEGRLNPADIIFCPGYFKLGSRTFLCWKHQGHGNVSFLTGFAQSCDVYFYKMGLSIGARLIEKYSSLFHLGEKTGIALKGEKAGNIFGPNTAAQSGKAWYSGDTLNLAIGQGRLLVTPIQMAVVAEALANHGTLWKPYYMRSIHYRDGELPYHQNPRQIGFVDVSERTWSLLDQAMSLVVASGTAQGAFIPGINVWGKTGTAQNSSGRDHSWFIAFAGKPGELPSIALSVLVENGGHGASVAVPIARQVIEVAFHVGKKSSSALSILNSKKPASILSHLERAL